MNQEYLNRFTDLARKAQEPLQKLTDLNVKTLQNFTYIRPEELANIRRPEQLLEKQVELAIANGHKALDYMQKSFNIMEKALLSFVQESKRNDKESML